VKRPSGGQPRTGKPSRNRLVVLLDDTELAQLDAYVAKHGRDRSHWVRKALQKLGALKGASK
jgi:metal-responsive CopG/Arc/MetJ family transcriptional regulator